MSRRPLLVHGLVLLWLTALPGLAVVPAGAQEQPPPEDATTPESEAAPPPAAAPGPPDEDDADRIRFEGLIELEGGEKGKVAGSADSLEYDGTGRAVLAGNVVIRFEDLTVRADRIELDEGTQDLIAIGNVVFDKGPQRLSGESLEYNLETELGRMVGVTGAMGTDYFFVGEEVLKVGENRYRVLDGRFTSCQADPAPWSFGAKRIDVTVDGYARVRNVTFRAKDTPVLWFPYVLWPVKDDRTSGFLMPKPGYSSRRGASLGLAYYWAMARSYDTTFHLDLFTGADLENPTGTGQYLGFGNEFRYHPSEGTIGRFEGYGIDDPERDEFRWRLLYDHESRDLGWGLRGVVHYEDASDFDYFQDFERRGDRNSIRQLYSTGFVSGNWGPHSLLVNLDQRETFFSQDSIVTLAQLPEVEYRLRPTRLGGTPLYLQMFSSAHLLDMERSSLLDNSYARADLFPELTLPIRTVPWLSLSLTAGGRATWYGDSLYTAEEKAERPDRDSDFRDESFTRVSPTARAEIIGPSFSRIFGGQGETASKYKHIIEPRFNYVYLDEEEEDERVPVFDEIDRLNAANVVSYSLINRVLFRPGGEDGGSAAEILSFELGQEYSLDDDQPLQRSSDRSVTSQEGPVRALLRYQPSRSTTLRLESRYSTLFSRIQSNSLSGSFALAPRTRVGLRYTNRVDPEDGDTLTDQIRLFTLFPLTRQLSFDAQVNYDIDREITQMQRYMARWQGSCYELLLEYADFQFGNRRDQEWRLSLSLKNVGKFLDITGGNQETL